MAEKIMQSRIILKHDIEENWLKAVNFIPRLGEMIIYDIDSTHDYERIKVGDGVTLVSDLPFLLDNAALSDEEINTICDQAELDYSAATLLKNFNYNITEDGQYEITEWIDDGSTVIDVPDNSHIII